MTQQRSDAASSDSALPVKGPVEDAVTTAEVASLLGQGDTDIIGSKNDAKEQSSTVVQRDEGQADEMMIVLKKFKIERFFFDSVECQFWDIFHALLGGVAYSAQDLCGDEFWLKLSPYARRQATHCLKHLAELPDVPLFGFSCPDRGYTVFQIPIGAVAA